MIRGYRAIEKQYQKKVTTIVVYSGGGISLEEAWSLSPPEFKELDNIVNEKIEMMVKIGKIGL